MSWINEYVSLFETLAKNHEEILHRDGEKHFFRLEPEEYLTGLTSEVNFPAMMLEGYDIGFGDKEANSILKYINGGFAILDRVGEQQDMNGIHEVWDRCEVICTDILVRIYNEKYSRHGIVVKLDFNNIQIQLLANETDGTYGVRCTFSLMTKQPHYINNSKWSDLE
jgi:hypothetical protein